MGGKSRKSGGVSKKLIAQIKAGNYSSGEGKKKKCVNKKYTHDTTTPKGLFDID